MRRAHSPRGVGGAGDHRKRERERAREEREVFGRGKAVTRGACLLLLLLAAFSESHSERGSL